MSKLHKFKKAALSIVAICAVVAICIYAYPHYFSKKIAAHAKEEAPSYRVMKMQANTNEVELILPSYLEAINFTPIWSRVNGYLLNFLVDIGDKVKEGQILAEVDAPDLDQELAQARADLDSFIAKENIAFITANRWTELYIHNPEAISAEEVDQNIAAYEAAVADVEAAEANVGRLQVLQNYKFICAPFDGTITERDIDIGSLVTLGSNNNPQGYPQLFPQKRELFQIVRTDTLRAFVDVPQSFFYFIKDGLKAEVRIPELQNTVFTGNIDRNAKSLDPLARTLLTQVNIENKNGQLLPGLYAEIKFTFKPERINFLIPIAALIVRNGPTFVAVMRDNKVYFQKVTIGLDHGRYLQIIDGLQENDEILVNPGAYIKEGMTIKPELISAEQAKKLTS